MDRPFDPALYKDEYQERLKEVIEQKISGKEVVAASSDQPKSNIINLMDALKASIDQNNPKVEKPKRNRKIKDA